jgi:serine/threonine protein kinase
VPVVVKIEVKRIANPDEEREARSSVFKEVLIGMLLDRVFYRGRVTPSVTRTLAVFQCPHLPPPIGAWKSLTDAIWPHGVSDVRSQVAASPSKQYLYTEQEFANAGTIDGLVLSRPTPALAAMSNPADHKMFVRSLTFQALYTLEAFRRAGFIHADINLNNVALEELMSVGEGHRRVYFVNRLGGPHETILAFDPFGQTTHNRFRLKFIDYGNSMFAYRDPRRMEYGERMRLIAMPGQRIVPALTPIYNSPPEAVMRDAIVFDETGKTDVDTHWWVSTAADLWQVCMILVTLVFGEHPLFGSILQSPPNKFRDRVVFHIKSHPDSYGMLEYNNMTKDIPSHLWNIAVLIGVPGTDLRSGLIDPKQRDMLESRYPLLANFRLAGAKQTGWLRASKQFKEFFGVGLGLMILRSLGWDPTLRPVPGEILADPKVLETFRAFQYVPFGGNPRDVSMKLHNRVMYKEEMEAWSLLASDISYHVPISKPLKGRGPSRFTHLPKELAECIEAEFFEEEEEETEVPSRERKEEARGSNWSRWMF